MIEIDMVKFLIIGLFVLVPFSILYIWVWIKEYVIPDWREKRRKKNEGKG